MRQLRWVGVAVGTLLWLVTRTAVAAGVDAGRPACSIDGFCEKEPGALHPEIAAVWETGQTGYAVGIRGTIEHLVAGAWNPMPSPTQETLRVVTGSGPSDLWAAGAKGTLLHGDGQSWRVIPMPSPGSAVTLVASKVGEAWVLLDTGALLHADLKGAVAVPLPASDAWRVLVGANDDLYLMGKRVLLHFDGQRWLVLGMGGVDPQEDLNEDELLYLGPHNLWLTNSGSATHWDGRTWKAQTFEVPSASAGGAEPRLHTFSASADGALGIVTSPRSAGDQIVRLRVAKGQLRLTAMQQSPRKVTALSGGPSNLWVVTDGCLAHWNGVRWTGLPAWPAAWDIGQVHLTVFPGGEHGIRSTGFASYAAWRLTSQGMKQVEEDTTPPDCSAPSVVPRDRDEPDACGSAYQRATAPKAPPLLLLPHSPSASPWALSSSGLFHQTKDWVPVGSPPGESLVQAAWSSGAVWALDTEGNLWRVDDHELRPAGVGLPALCDMGVDAQGSLWLAGCDGELLERAAGPSTK